MASQKEQPTRNDLLLELYDARKRVAALENLLARHDALHGNGVDREAMIGKPSPEAEDSLEGIPEYLTRPGEDISNYLGREGHDDSRPRLGPDAPPEVRPDKPVPVSPLVSQLIAGHPDDGLDLLGLGASPSLGAQPVFPPERHEDKNGGGAFFAPLADEGEAASETAEAPETTAEAEAPPPAARPSSPSLYCPACGEARDDDCLRSCLVLRVFNEGVWDWDLRTGKVYASRCWQSIMGNIRPEKGSPLEDFARRIHPADVASFRAHFTDLLNGNAQFVSMNLRFAREDHSWGWGVLRAVSVRMEAETVRIIAVVRDITLSQRMMENYQALFNTMDDGFILFEHVSEGRDGVPRYSADEFALVAMNPSFARLFALDASTSIGRRLDEMMGADAGQWADCLRRVLGDERACTDFLHNTVVGRQFEISAYSPEAGKVACIVKDVTEMRRIEQESRLNESRFAALYRLSHMDDVSEEQLMRFSLDQLLQFSDSELGYLYAGDIHEGREDRIYWSDEAMARFKNDPPLPPLCHPARLNGPDGQLLHEARAINAVDDSANDIFGPEIFVNRYMVAPVLEGGRIVCLAAVANKDEKYQKGDLLQLERFLSGVWFNLRRRWAVRALQIAKETAETANRAKNEFLANVSHELRTPLNGILGMLQMLQQSSLSAAQMEYVATAYYSGRSLLRIISEILDFSKIEAGSFTLEPRLFDFPATVRSTLGMFIQQAKQENIQFSLHMDDAIPDVLVGDDVRVRQIIFNLLSNAFKFTSKGVIEVECALLPYRRAGKHNIYLAVRDTGIGIPDEHLGHVFRAFTQIDGSSTRRYSGTGLGLAIVGQLVSLMGGTISVESTPGKGTTVHCSLPFDEPQQLPESVQTPLSGAKAVEPLSILVVEDDLVSQFTLRSLLKKAGHSSVCVGNGRQAIEALLLQSFDCIITDIQMPVMDGVELVSRIRSGNTVGIEPTPEVRRLFDLNEGEERAHVAIAQDIPIVALTAHAMAGDRERFLGMGMDYYLAKPVFAAELSVVLGHISMLLHVHKNI